MNFSIISTIKQYQNIINRKLAYIIINIRMLINIQTNDGIVDLTSWTIISVNVTSFFFTYIYTTVKLR